MTEKVAEIWERLSEEAKRAALFLSVADNRTGIRFEDFGYAEVSKEAIQELVDSGLVEIKSRIQIAKEFVEEYKDEAKPTSDYQLWDTFRNERSIAEYKDGSMRYRFVSAEIVDFVSEQFES